MDTTFIKTDKLNKLKTIGQLTAVNINNCEEFVKLASLIEQYINNPSTDLIDQLKSQLTQCSNIFPQYQSIIQSQINTLLELGYLSKQETSVE
jgi:hypothetical protein